MYNIYMYCIEPFGVYIWCSYVTVGNRAFNGSSGVAIRYMYIGGGVINERFQEQEKS